MTEQLEKLSEDDCDLYSFSGDPDDEGRVLTQHRYYRFGNSIVAIGELNFPNHWDDDAFDADCAALTAPTRDGEVGRLREALEPFARYAEQYDRGGQPQKRPLAEDYRRARAALATE